MKRVACLLLLVLLGGCEAPPSVGWQVGQKAPDFKGTDVEGKTISLGDYAGKVVLIDFWATWCGPCRAEIPKERELARIYQKRPFAILGISADQSEANLRKFLEREQLPWENILDDGSIGGAWGVQALPSFVLLDHNGVIKERWQGGGQGEAIRKSVDAAVRRAEAR